MKVVVFLSLFHPSFFLLMHFRTIGILGVGHIGGSFLKAFRSLKEVPRLVVGDTEEETLRVIRENDWAEEVFNPLDSAPEQAFAHCDLVLFAMPPAAVSQILPRFSGSEIPLLSDVASVKGPVLEAAKGLGNFIGGHPMAGTEGVGIGAANPLLFRNAAFILCEPEDCRVRPEIRDAYHALLKEIGFRLFEMDARTHDHRLALISHLPHVASFALAELAAMEKDALLKDLIGGGFRDTTRIAASAPKLWTEILRASPALPEVLDAYIRRLQQFRALLSQDRPSTELFELLHTAEHYRRQIPEGLHRVPHAASDEISRSSLPT